MVEEMSRSEIEGVLSEKIKTKKVADGSKLHNCKIEETQFLVMRSKVKG